MWVQHIMHKARNAVMLLKHCSFTSSALLQRRLCPLFEEQLQMRP